MTQRRQDQLKTARPIDGRAIEDWLAHPVTERLKLALEADTEALIEFRSDGGCFKQDDLRKTYDLNMEVGLKIYLLSVLLEALYEQESAERFLNRPENEEGQNNAE